MTTHDMRLSGTELLRQRHQEIKNLFDKTLAVSGDERSEVFNCLRATLAVHETVEEMFVHPLAKDFPGGEAIVAARLEEERAAKVALVELEDLGPHGDQFATHLTMFMRDVLAHAAKEEAELFPLLERECSDADMQALADTLLTSASLAPTHPHPHAGDNPTVLMLAGPFVAMADKVRDHFGKQSTSP